MQINKKKIVQVDVKEIRIHVKCTDYFTASLNDAAGDIIAQQEDGGVASFFPGEHYGEYIILNIDLETGRVTNWKPPTAKQVEALIAKWQGESSE